MEKYQLITKIVNSMEKIFPEREPANEEYSHSMFLNERLNFQIAICNLESFALKRNVIKVRGDLADYVTVREVVLMPATSLPATYVDDYYLKKEPGLYPDLLRPYGVLGMVLQSNCWSSAWVSVDLPEDVTPGKHEIYFDIYNESGYLQTTLTYTVDVIGAKLEQYDMHVTSWMHYDCIANYHGLEPFTPEYYDVFEKYLASYVDIGYNMLLVPLFTPPLDTAVGHERRTAQLVKVSVRQGKYSFDLSEVEKFLDFVLARGIKYIEFSHLFTQWGGKHCPKIMADVDGEEKKIFGWENDSLGEEYKTFLGEFLPKLVELINRKNLHDVCFFHVTDEPQMADIEQYKGCNELVKKYVGDIPTFDAISDYEFYEMGAVDIPVPVTNACWKFLDKGYTKGLHVYYCCGPTNNHHSNRMVNMPSQRMRIMGMQLYLNDAGGFLQWGFNFYNSQHSWCAIDPYTDLCSGGIFPAGDAFIVYPDKERGGVLYSLRAETHKEMMQDYCALKTLEKLTSEEYVKELLKEEGMERYHVYPRSLRWHDGFRQKINELIRSKLS